MNKYLEKLAVDYHVPVPTGNAWGLVDAKSISLSPKEYRQFKADTDKHWTGKSMAGSAAVGGVMGGAYGLGLGTVIDNITNRDRLPKFKSHFNKKFFTPYSALVGAAIGLAHSHNKAKAKALEHHLPEFDDLDD